MTNFLYYLAGAVIVLALMYHLGKRTGKNEQKTNAVEAEAKKTKEVLDNVRNVYNMSDDELADRMQKYGDK